jgi:hypothetical protein
MWFVCKPTDVDGDGIFTITDAYKWAGMLTNQHLLGVKQQSLSQIFRISLSETIAALTQTSISQQLSQQAKYDFIKLADTVLNSQTPWMLHANLARKMFL